MIILEHHPLKMMHLIYRQAGLASHFWQMESTKEEVMSSPGIQSSCVVNFIFKVDELLVENVFFLFVQSYSMAGGE